MLVLSSLDDLAPLYEILTPVGEDWRRQRLGGGGYTRTWDGRDDSGRAAPAGVYHCRLTSGEASRTAKLVVVR